MSFSFPLVATILFLLGAISSTVMYALGQKQIKNNYTKTQVDLAEGTPEQLGETNFKYTGIYKVGDKTFNFEEYYPQKAPLPIVLYCVNGKDDYEKQQHCVDNLVTFFPTYIERNVKTNRDAMIACWVLFAIFAWFSMPTKQ